MGSNCWQVKHRNFPGVLLLESLRQPYWASVVCAIFPDFKCILQNPISQIPRFLKKSAFATMGLFIYTYFEPEYHEKNWLIWLQGQFLCRKIQIFFLLCTELNASKCIKIIFKIWFLKCRWTGLMYSSTTSLRSCWVSSAGHVVVWHPGTQLNGIIKHFLSPLSACGFLQ